jgi:glucose/arabinose dehydrogenase
MKAMTFAVFLAATSVAMPAAYAQRVPATPADVAKPSGKVPGAPKLALVKVAVADGFHDPVGVTAANDGSGRIFVVERAGRVRIVGKDGKVQAEPFIDLTNFNPLGSDVQTGFVEQGLWSIALHPKFKDNGYVFVHYASLPFNGASIIARITVDPKSPNQVTSEQLTKSVKVLMNIPQPYYNHYGGMITFGPDGKLYIGKGDAGWEGDPLNAGQNLNVLWGKLLRIDVDTPDDVAYAIPKDNPFGKADKAQLMSLFGINEQGFAQNKIGSQPEIWAYGLRNPYMFHFDPKSGDLFIADVGQNHWEEINYQPASSKGGENYGWKFNQGSYCHPALSEDQKCPIVGVLPAAEYPHD